MMNKTSLYPVDASFQTPPEVCELMVSMRHLVSFGLKSITPLPRRTFQYARIQTVVIELQKGYQGKTIFHTPFHIEK
jgi:hypothetical protein